MCMGHIGRARRTKLSQLEVGARRAPILQVQSCEMSKIYRDKISQTEYYPIKIGTNSIPNLKQNWDECILLGEKTENSIK